MGKKYMIKVVKDTDEVLPELHHGCIVELEGIQEEKKEPITEPAEPKMEYECHNCGYQYYPMKPKEQSLEEKIRRLIDERQFKGTFVLVSELAQIAKEHFQEHPEEIGLAKYYPCREDNGYWSVFKTGVPFAAEDMLNEFNKLKKEREGMVSLDKVLEVFDENTIGKPICEDFNQIQSFIRKIRKAIEGMRK